MTGCHFQSTWQGMAQKGGKLLQQELDTRLKGQPRIRWFLKDYILSRILGFNQNEILNRVRHELSCFESTTLATLLRIEELEDVIIIQMRYDDCGSW